MGGGDGTSSVTPWGRTFNVLGGGGILAKGDREGGKEGIEGRDRREGPWTGPLRQRKGPKGNPQGAAKGTRLPSYSRSEARADKSIMRKQTRHKARKPKARRSGFISGKGSELLNHNSAFKFDDFGPVSQPLKRGLVL